MNIGIIGAGHIGGTLARRFTAAGHSVAIANSRGPASLAALAAELGATAVTVEEAAQGRDLVVVTIPMKNLPKLPPGLFSEVPNTTVVVDTN
ncbi:MAG: NAD(P)-binding domain-containing protein, partial [Terriglobales bacterium]